MNRKKTLSSSFNMSWGFIPIIITMVMCQYVTSILALCLGLCIGLGGIYYKKYNKEKVHIPNFILYISTFMIIPFIILTFYPQRLITSQTLPFALELSILFSFTILYPGKRLLECHIIKRTRGCNKRIYKQGTESTAVSIRLFLILGWLHLCTLIIMNLEKNQISQKNLWIMIDLLPILVFTLVIILNQFAIKYFNRLMSNIEYLPIVNIHGDVIGKSPLFETIMHKNSYITPIIRIAIYINGMLFLCKRPFTALLDKGTTDIPLECYLQYGETLDEGVKRIINNTFSADKFDIKKIVPKFNIMYHFESPTANCLIYLYLIELKDESLLCSSQLKSGKLWCFKQIEENLGKNFFCNCFEEEYEYLKNTICIRDKYKES
ncbi:MAG: hypothetical protein WCR45_06095 [Bacteroidaceae bacterium]|nr:hypothetical protein [Bacteroidaceae bacterium]